MNLSDQLSIINRHVKSVPVDVFGMANELGLDCHAAYLDDEISGMLESSNGDKYKLTYNASHPETRQRFTVAHEIGHFLLHKKLIGDGVDDNRAYISTEIGKYHNTAIGPKEETEANKLAATILMPSTTLKRLMIDESHLTDTELANKFKVSIMAMSIRKSNLN